jgi:hypothetical protein
MNFPSYRAPRFRTTVFQARRMSAPRRFRVVKFRVRSAPR